MDKDNHTNGVWRKIQVFLLGGFTIFLILTAIAFVPILLAGEPGLLWALPYVMLMGVMYPPAAISIIVIGGLLTVRSAGRREVRRPWATGGWRLFTVFILVAAAMWGLVMLKEYLRFSPEQRAQFKLEEKIMFSDDILYLLSVIRDPGSNLHSSALMSIGSLIHGKVHHVGKRRIVNFTDAQAAEMCRIFLEAVHDPDPEMRRVALSYAGDLFKLRYPPICEGETGDTLAYIVIESMGDPVRLIRQSAMHSARQALARLGSKSEPLFHDLLAERLRLLLPGLPGNQRYLELRETLWAIGAKPELFSDQKKELASCAESPDKLVREKARHILLHMEAPSSE
jgi:hypothetical protein